MLTGTRVGPYEVVGSLGAGGMGEVYRARDTQLNRDVAIKVLPPLFASDPESLARFEREAQTLAALNHPHIAQVYGFERTGDSRALVMELVDGEDLAQRLARGPIPQDEAVTLARQIADALEAAHERGIIHRDLKPANIKVRADGTVKVLDFGLAKALDPALSSSGALHDSPTLTSPAQMTRAGIVLGTAAYMAPEQARGKAVDKRADIWAFGVVLFEMLAGEKLFTGDTVSETLAAVIKDDVRLERLPADTSLSVRRLLQRCLERDPKLRLRDIGEARLALAVGDESRATPVVAPHRRRSPWVGVAVVLLALVAGAALGALWLDSNRSSVMRPAHFTLPIDALGQGPVITAVSPDGRHVALIGDTGVWVRPMHQNELRHLVADVEPLQVFWSPDSKTIGYAVDGALMKVPLEGGAPVRIADISKLPGPFNPMGGGVWLPNDTIVFTTGFTGLMQAPAGGGEPTTLVAPATGTEDFHGLDALPSGGFVTIVHDDDAVDTVVALRNGQRVVVWQSKGQDVAAPRYSATGHVLVDRIRTGELWAVPFDEKSLQRTGEPFVLLPSSEYSSVSADGSTLVTTSRGSGGSSDTSLVSADGKVLQRVGGSRNAPSFATAALSSDGRRVALVSLESGMPSAWIYPLGAGLATQVTEGVPVTSVSWLPKDSGLLLVIGQRWCLSGNCFSIERRAVNGGSPTPIAKGWSPAVSPDGQSMVFSRRTDAEWDLAVQPLEPNAAATAFQGGPGWQWGPQFSPDGRYVTYMSTERGRSDVYVAPYPSGEKRRVTRDGGYWPQWSRDGRRLFFARGTGVYAVDVSTTDSFSVGDAKEVLPQGSIWQIRETRWPSPFTVAADGSFLIQRPVVDAKPVSPVAHVLFDWHSPRK